MKEWLFILKTCLLIVAAVSIIPITLSAQLKVNFTMDNESGCAPLLVNFNNLTGGAGTNASYSWNLGNGNKSEMKSPAAIYTEAGNYTVTLTVLDGGQSATYSRQIVVSSKPQVQIFLSDSIGCLPFEGRISAVISNSGASGYTYYWDFGDGRTQSSLVAEMNHPYAEPGSYPVNVTVKDKYGCAASTGKPAIVNVHPAIYSSFAAGSSLLCRPGDSIQFNNYSGGGDNLKYTWNWGDGSYSSEKQPIHQYMEKGVYSVSLTVENEIGCKAVSNQSNVINVASYSSNFSAPAKICQGSEARFTAINQPSAASSRWVVDGSSFFDYYGYLNYYFNTTGKHTVQLINQFGNCRDTVTRTVLVDTAAKTPKISYEVKGFCGAPVEVQFSESSENIIQWKWNFNDPYDLTPVVADSGKAKHVYTRYGLYPARLEVLRSNGCRAVASKYINIVGPQVDIVMQNTTGSGGNISCGPMESGFKANSPYDSIVTYHWDFGDDSTSNEAEPRHWFRKPGEFQVKLQYRTKSGCESTAYYNKIVIYNKPVADFVVRGSGDICGNTPAYFNSKVSGNNEHYYWDLGDGTATTGYAPQHQYRVAGSYTVMLITVNGLCRDTMVKKDIVRVTQPFPKIKTVTNTCEGDRTEVVFADASTGADSLTWVWGDGQQQNAATTTTGISHRYSGTGSYKVVLIAHKDQCHTRDSVIARVMKKQSPRLTTDKQLVCKDGRINYTIDKLQDNPGFDIYHASPYWVTNFLYSDNSVYTGQSGLNSNYTYIKSGWLANIQPGKDSIAAIVKSAYFGCFDTSNYVPVAIQSPSAGFKVLKEPQCLNSIAIFLDTSHASDNSRLVGHTWQMGDGQSIYVENKDTVIYSYSHPGYYHVTLSVTDDKGCSAASSTAGTTVSVKGPEAKFNPSGDHLPKGSTIEFYNRSITTGSSQVEYYWDFGDGQKAVGFNAAHQYPLPGNYEVKLVAKDPTTGCVSADYYTIHIEPFNAGFRYSGSTLASHDCYPLQIQFTNTSVNYSKLKWDFGDGTLVYNISNPSHIYKEAGTYIVKLEVVNYNGEVKSYFDTLHLQPPIAFVQVTPSNACLGDPVTLKFNGSSDLKYSWDLGDGHILKGNDSLTNYVFSHAGEFNPRIMFGNGDGCITFFKLKDTIKIHDKPLLAVNPSQPVICRGTAQNVQLSGGDRYEWSPADGVSDTHAAAPLLNPSQSSKYQIKLWDAWGCSNYDSLWVEVIAPPSIWIAADTAICRGDSFMIRAGGADRYSWIDETGGLNDIHINNPLAKPDRSILYTLLGSDRMGCFTDTASLRVTVMDLPTVDLSPELDVMPGQALPLEAHVSPDVQVITWTPTAYLSCVNCITPVCRPEQDMEYIAKVSNADRCTATAKVKVKLICDETRVAIPNAFTPNSDGKNDLFVIRGISRIRHLLIYNRWGQKIFERRNFVASDPAGCWNGTIGGFPAETGTYVYYVEMECPEGGMFFRKGTVTLIR